MAMKFQNWDMQEKKLEKVKEKLLRMILDGEVLNEKNSLLKVVKNFQKIR